MGGPRVTKPIKRQPTLATHDRIHAPILARGTVVVLSSSPAQFRSFPPALLELTRPAARCNVFPTPRLNTPASGKTGRNAGAIMKSIAAATLDPRARITGVVYLLYFLTAILAQFFVARKLIEYGEVVNGIAFGFYIVLTLLFYFMFKPVNGIVSLSRQSSASRDAPLESLTFFMSTPPTSARSGFSSHIAS